MRPVLRPRLAGASAVRRLRKGTRRLAIAARENMARREGELAFAGKVHANLEKLSETFRIEGALTAKNVRYIKWKADEISCEGSWAMLGDGLSEVVRPLLPPSKRLSA